MESGSIPNETGVSGSRTPPGWRLAVLSETLFLINLLVLPGLGFLALAWFWFRERKQAPSLARCHLEQTFFVSLTGGLILVAACAVFVWLGGLEWAWTWVLVIVYFTCIHSTLVVFGIVGLARAIAGATYVYPLIGPRLAD